MKTCKRCRMPMVKSGSQYMCVCGNIERYTAPSRRTRLGNGKLISLAESNLNNLHIARIINSINLSQARNLVLDTRLLNGCYTVVKSTVPEQYMRQYMFEELTYSNFMNARQSDLWGKDILINIR